MERSPEEFFARHGTTEHYAPDDDRWHEQAEAEPTTSRRRDVPRSGGAKLNSEPSFWVDNDDDWSEADIPPRPWIVPGFLMRGVLTLVIGAPVVGKSVLGLLWATVLALGEDHGRFRTGGVERRTLVLNAEDPRDEQRRRMSALLRQFGKRPADLGGRLIRIGPTKIATLFIKDEVGEILETDAFDEMKKLLVTSKVDVVILDPLVELTAGVDENSNGDMSKVVGSASEFWPRVLTDIGPPSVPQPTVTLVLPGGSEWIGLPEWNYLSSSVRSTSSVWGRSRG